MIPPSPHPSPFLSSPFWSCPCLYVCIVCFMLHPFLDYYTLPIYGTRFRMYVSWEDFAMDFCSFSWLSPSHHHFSATFWLHQWLLCSCFYISFWIVVSTDVCCIYLFSMALWLWTIGMYWMCCFISIKIQLKKKYKKISWNVYFMYNENTEQPFCEKQGSVFIGREIHQVLLHNFV